MIPNTCGTPLLLYWFNEFSVSWRMAPYLCRVLPLPSADCPNTLLDKRLLASGTAQDMTINTMAVGLFPQHFHCKVGPRPDTVLWDSMIVDQIFHKPSVSGAGQDLVGRTGKPVPGICLFLWQWTVDTSGMGGIHCALGLLQAALKAVSFSHCRLEQYP